MASLLRRSRDACLAPVEGRRKLAALGGGATNAFRPWPLGPLSDLEFDAVAFAQVRNRLAHHGTLVEEVFLPSVVLDEPKTLVAT